MRYEASPRTSSRNPCSENCGWVRDSVGLDTSLHEVVLLGLITCEEVRVVKRVHLLSGEVRSVTTALKVVEEVQEEVQETKDE